MSFASEFKEFAVKGNVMDLAVGVIIGAAFGKIVDSVVGDLIMPIVGKIFGGLDFSGMYIPLNGQANGLLLAEAKKAGDIARATPGIACAGNANVELVLISQST